jgi:hypothetical protein
MAKISSKNPLPEGEGRGGTPQIFRNVSPVEPKTEAQQLEIYARILEECGLADNRRGPPKLPPSSTLRR